MVFFVRTKLINKGCTVEAAWKRDSFSPAFAFYADAYIHMQVDMGIPGFSSHSFSVIRFLAFANISLYNQVMSGLGDRDISKDIEESPGSKGQGAS